MKKYVIILLILLAGCCQKRNLGYPNLPWGKNFWEIKAFMKEAGYTVLLEAPTGKAISFENGKFLTFDTSVVMMDFDDLYELKSIYILIEDRPDIFYDLSMNLFETDYGSPTEIKDTDGHKINQWLVQGCKMSLALRDDKAVFSTSIAHE